MNNVQLHSLYIHGQYFNATSGQTFDSINPATGQVIATIQQASKADVDSAVQSAVQGQRNGLPKLRSSVPVFYIVQSIFYAHVMTS